MPWFLLTEGAGIVQCTHVACTLCETPKLPDVLASIKLEISSSNDCWTYHATQCQCSIHTLAPWLAVGIGLAAEIQNAYQLQHAEFQPQPYDHDHVHDTSDTRAASAQTLCMMELNPGQGQLDPVKGIAAA